MQSARSKSGLLAQKLRGAGRRAPRVRGTSAAAPGSASRTSTQHATLSKGDAGNDVATGAKASSSEAGASAAGKGSSAAAASPVRTPKKRKRPAAAWTITPALQTKADRLQVQLQELYPDMPCPLDSESNFQLLIAVILSSQVRGSIAVAI